MRKIRILATANHTDRFDIYLDVSGERHYLMSHRWNSPLYQLLKEGVSVDQLERAAQKKVVDVSYGRFYKKRCRPGRKRRKNISRKLENSVRHLHSAVEEYLLYEAA